MPSICTSTLKWSLPHLLITLTNQCDLVFWIPVIIPCHTWLVSMLHVGVVAWAYRLCSITPVIWGLEKKTSWGKSQHSLLRSTVKYCWRITCVWNWVVPNSNYLTESYQNFIECYATMTRKMLYISWNRIIFSGHNLNVFQYLWYQRAVTYELAVTWGHYIYLGSQVKIT